MLNRVASQRHGGLVRARDRGVGIAGARRAAAPRRRSRCRSAISAWCRPARLATSTTRLDGARATSSPSMSISTPFAALGCAWRRDRRSDAAPRCRRPASASRWRATPRSPSSIRICWTAGARRAPRSAFFSPLADEGAARRLRRLLAARRLSRTACRPFAASARSVGGLRAFAETRPVHGECGGYMVLGAAPDRRRRARARDGRPARRRHQLCQTPHASRLSPRASSPRTDRSARRATSWRGHEFHYATVSQEGRDPPLAMARDAHSQKPFAAGARRGNVSGSFFHAIASQGA